MAKLPKITDGITDVEAEASATFDLTIDEVREACRDYLAKQAATAGPLAEQLRAAVDAAGTAWTTARTARDEGVDRDHHRRIASAASAALSHLSRALDDHHQHLEQR